MTKKILSKKVYSSTGAAARPAQRYRFSAVRESEKLLRWNKEREEEKEEEEE
jgi:hypothetical protein